MLLKNENQIIRVLKAQGDKALVIDCIKRTMPKWVDDVFLSNYVDCGEDEMFDRTDYQFGRELTPNEQRIAQERFTMISGVLPFIGNEQKRSQMIDFLAEHQSKQTIRKYLCLYLVYQDIDALAPPPRTEKELSQDEKNMRWALNKFFYTKHKNSLNTAYTLMLKEKYCDQQGQLVAAYPTFDQFRYFYRKTKKMQQYYISRDGIKDYQRNNRPLLGDGVQQFAPAVGVGMLDSTICDIYLVDDGSKLVGRPVMTSCIDAFSGLCCGYSLGWEGGTYSLRGLMLNVIADKQEWCESHGVFIDDIGTFHSICLRFIKEHIEYTRISKNYRTLDDFDQTYTVFQNINRFRNLKDFDAAIDAQGAWKQSQAICGYVNNLVEELVEADTLMKDRNPSVSGLGRILQEYQYILEENDLLDFSAIQTEAYNLIKDNPEVLEEIRNKIKYLMIDEYQDTNYIQEQLVFLLAGEKQNICVVGDDDQGLYRFRGATIRNILEFPQKFEDGKCHTVALTVNYRSNIDIVDFYNTWIAIHQRTDQCTDGMAN